MSRIFFVLLILFSFMNLKAQTINPAPTFTVVNSEETMPVWVYGNPDSGIILLAVHGGPGSDVLDFRNYLGGKGFRQIEKQHLIAYWQQRASGQSYGSDDSAYFTINQYVEDLDRIIEEIKSRYPDKKIALFGHSWGGMLTSSYLKKPERSGKIQAWINASGVTDSTVLLEASVLDINEEADKRINQQENIAYWKNLKDRLNNLNANATAYALLEQIPEVEIKVNMGDFKFTQRALTSNRILFQSIKETDNTEALNNFTKPVLVLWGQYDFAVSKQIRDAALANLTKAKVTNVLFRNSGHYMMFHEPEEFARSIISFLGTL